MLSTRVALLAEGSSEQAVLDVLLDNDLLFVTREQLVNESVLRVRQAKKFERLYLRHSLPKKMKIYRIHDSRKEAFNLSKVYVSRVELPIQEIYTTPEIEMLFIIYEGDYDAYVKKQKSKIKPSDYVKKEYGKKYTRCKEYSFVYDFWSNNLEKLLECINEFARVTTNAQENTISALLKQDAGKNDDNMVQAEV